MLPRFRRHSGTTARCSLVAHFQPFAAALTLGALSPSAAARPPAEQPPAPPPSSAVPTTPAPSPTDLPPITAPALRAVVTIAPLKSFVEPLLPVGSELRVLMQPGKSEHGYEFTPSDLRAIAEADVVVLVGLSLEPAVEHALATRKNPSRRVVRFSDVVKLIPAASGASKPDGDKGEAADDHDHDSHADHEHADHEHDEDCDHGPVDVHLWLDPALCTQLVDAVRAAVEQELTERDAMTDGARAALDARAADTRARIARVDAAWKDAAPSFRDQPIITHHNAFGRLAERYDLNIAAVIRVNATSDPSPSQVAQVARTIREQHVRAIFVEPQYNRKLADRIAKTAGVSVATLDPLGNGDWFAMMDANLAALRDNLAPKPAPQEATNPK